MKKTNMNQRTRMAVLLMAALVLGAALFGTGTALAAETNTTETESEQDVIRREMVELTNELREEQGMEPYRTDELLMKAAQVRAEELAANTLYAHTRPDGSKIQTVTDCAYVAENLHRISQRTLDYKGKTLAQEAVDGWENSPSHLASILNEKADAIGVGVAEGVNAKGEKAYYCVQLFLYKGYVITWVDEPML